MLNIIAILSYNERRSTKQRGCGAKRAIRINTTQNDQTEKN